MTDSTPSGAVPNGAALFSAAPTGARPTGAVPDGVVPAGMRPAPVFAVPSETGCANGLRRAPMSDTSCYFRPFPGRFELPMMISP